VCVWVIEIAIQNLERKEEIMKGHWSADFELIE
jgi:hypothetical protein